MAIAASFAMLACGPDETGAGSGGSAGNSNTGGAGGSAGGGTAGAGGGEAGAGGIGTGGMGGGSGGMGGAGGAPNIGQVGKIDLLLMIDNSRSMFDKQGILALTIPDLVGSLVNPACIDGSGAPAAQQPAGPADPCPVAGTTRQFAPVTDIHIGIISSSIGGHGSDACASDTNTCAGGTPNTTTNDKAHLLTRNDPCGNGQVPTYSNKGFLAWDPQQKLNPPGENDATILVGAFNDLVTGVGQIGCGYEAQLESWYRFLIEPEPYESLAIVNGAVTPQGTDATLLAQRKDFLRPDSLLTVLMLTDENDCSVREYGQFYLVSQLKSANGTAFHLPRARKECATNPNDPCCKSCAQSQGNCPADPTCVIAGQTQLLTDIEDPVNLRCFEQKRRFGIDFLYPLDRYTTGLSSPVVPDRMGNLVPNPLFSDLDPLDANSTIRDPGLVFVAGLVGVPWQDLARDPKDLTKGLKSPAELSAPNGQGMTTWDIVVGDPDLYIKPKDPHMIESIDPRSGTNPITGDAIKPPGNVTNPINGSEYSTPDQDDLQYACIFPLPAPRDCSDPSNTSCDCTNPQNDNPLCDPNPSSPGSNTLQARAKAYPGLRELSLLRKLGDQAVAASVCPAQLDDMAGADFGYRPATRALIERIKPRLKP